jgi:low affinity Fe/Cu permease
MLDFQNESFYLFTVNTTAMNERNKKNFFERFANKMTAFTGSSYAFIGAVSIVILWATTGPIFGYSETWQLVINTGTTIITFLMVFLIQKTQNKDSKAIQLKLNELIAANTKASNRMVDIEDLTEQELDHLHVFYKKLSVLARQESNIHQSHSIDAAEKLHRNKKRSLLQSENESSIPASAEKEGKVNQHLAKSTPPASSTKTVGKSQTKSNNKTSVAKDGK